MLRFAYAQNVNKNLLKSICTARAFSVTSLQGNKKKESGKESSKNNNDDDIGNGNEDGTPKKKVDINSLIMKMEGRSEKEGAAINLLQNLTSGKKRRTPRNKVVSELTRLKSEEGKEFLFGDVNKKEEIVDSEKIGNEDSNNISSSEQKYAVGMEKSKPTISNEDIDYEDLVKPTVEDVPNTGLSELVDEIDEDVPNPEEEQSEPEHVSQYHEGNIVQLKDHTSDLPSPKGMAKYLIDAIDTSRTETVSIENVFSRARQETQLFGTYDEAHSKHDHKMSLHEEDWKKSLNNMIGSDQPQNQFEAMMLDIDKQWKFPIDNQQDMGIEEETSFIDHVFLDHYLEEFPDVEPIQKFMELVITGLQQNPYLSVAEKRGRITWYKDYFEKFSKEELL